MAAISRHRQRIRRRLTFLWVVALISALLTGPTLSGGFALGDSQGETETTSTEAEAQEAPEDATATATATTSEGDATVTATTAADEPAAEETTEEPAAAATDEPAAVETTEEPAAAATDEPAAEETTEEPAAAATDEPAAEETTEEPAAAATEEPAAVESPATAPTPRHFDPAIDLEKYSSVDGPGGPWANGDRPETAVGADVWIRIEIRNVGDADLTNLTFTDVTESGDGVDYQAALNAALGSPDCPSPQGVVLPQTNGTSINDGGAPQWSCVFGPFAALPGLHENRATVDSDALDEQGDPNGLHASDSDPSGYRGQQAPANPAIDVEKFVRVNDGQWQDADDPTGPTATVGTDQVWFRFVVTNTGDVPLSDVELTDTDFTIPDNTVASLGVGQSFERVIGPFPAQGGQHFNKATVTGAPPGGSGGPSQPPPFDGNEFSYLFVFENGTVAAGTSDDKDHDLGLGLSDETHLSCSDEFGFEDPNDGDPDGWGEKGAPDIDDDPGWRLLGYAIVKYKSDGTVDETCGGGDTGGAGVMDMDPAHYIGEVRQTNPAIDIEKFVIVDEANEPAPSDPRWDDADNAPGPSATTGAGTWFKFEVTNTGDVTLVDIDLTDTDFPIPGGQVPASLAPGDSFTIVVSGGPAIDGQHHDKATVVAAPQGGSNVSFPLPGDGVHEKGVVMIFANGQTVVGYTDDGDVDVASSDFVPPAAFIDTKGKKLHLSCSDDFGFDDGDPSNDGWSDNSGRFPNPTDHPDWRLVGIEIVKKYEDDNVTPKDWCDSGELTSGVMDMDPAYYNGQPDPASIDIEKQVSVDDRQTWDDADDPTGPTAFVGGDVWFKFIVKNTGGQTLTDLEVFELANTNYTFTFPANIIAANDPLAPGQEFMFELGPFPAVEGQHFNEVKVKATTTAPRGNFGPDPHPYPGVKRAYTILLADGQLFEGSSDGGDVELGLSDKVHVSCSDDFGFDDGDPSNDGFGEKGAPVQGVDPPIVAYFISVFKSDGSFQKSCGGGDAPQPQMVMDQDPAHYLGRVRPEPAIDIEKATNGPGQAPDDADIPTGPVILVGDQVTWTYVVTNTGNVPLADVTVVDDKVGAISCPRSSLGVGEQMTCTAAGTAQLGQYANKATTEGTAPDGTVVDDMDPSHYIGSERPMLGDFVWLDRDGDGIQDPDEPGIPGVRVELLLGTQVVNTTTTGPDGLYKFNDLDPGVPYKVRFEQPAGHLFTVPDAGGDDGKDSDADIFNGTTPPVTLTGSEFNDTLDAGLFTCPIDGAFVIDLTPDRLLDAAGRRMSGPFDAAIPQGNYAVTLVSADFFPGHSSQGQNEEQYYIELYDAGGALVYRSPAISDLPSSVNTLTELVSIGGALSGDAVTAKAFHVSVGGVSNSVNSINPVCAVLDPVDAKLGDFVWRDLNGDGIQDPGEPGIPDVTVQLLIGSTVVNVTTTDPDGKYEFAGLTPGVDYRVRFIRPSGHIFTVPNAGGDDAKDSDASIFTGETPAVSLDPNEFDDTIDAGLFSCPIDGANVVDLTGVRLLDLDGRRMAGPFPFDDPLAPGTYRVTMASADFGAEHGTQNQNEEQYYVEAYDAAGALVYRSPPISDLPNNLHWMTEEVDAAGAVTGTAVSLKAFHISVIGDSFSINSIDPLCVSFEPVTDFEFEKLINGRRADNPNQPPVPAATPAAAARSHGAPGVPNVPAGAPITVEFEVTLTSGPGVPAADISITDNVFGPIVTAGVPEPGISGPAGDDGDGVLELGESWIYTLNTNAPTPPLDPNASAPGRCSTSQAPDSQTLHKNTATVTVQGEEKKDDAHLCINDYEFDKLIDGLDADDPNDPANLPQVGAGAPIDVGFAVKLTSGVDVPASGIDVVDNVFGNIVLAGVLQAGVSGPAGDDGDGVLEVGETWVYTLTTNAPTPPLDPNASAPGRCSDSQDPDSQTLHKNTAIVTVDGVDKDDDAHACINDFNFDKLIDGLDADDPNDPAGLPKAAPGDPITVDFVLELTSGSAVQAADIDMTDNVFGDIVVAGVPEPGIAGPAGDDGDGVLETGETWTYTLSTVAPTPPLDPNASAPGRCSDSQDPDSQTLHKNTATVTVDGVDDRDDAHLCIGTFNFRKLIDQFDANDPNDPAGLPKADAGDPITVDFELELVSGGDVPAADIDITDNVFGDIVVAGVPQPGIAGPAGDDGDGVLEVGETWVYTLTTVAPTPPLDPSASAPGRCSDSQDPDSQTLHKNRATVTVSGVSLDDDAHLCVNDYVFNKLINGLDADDRNDPATLPKVGAGAPLTVDFAVELVSGENVPAADVSVTDDVFGNIVLSGVPEPGVSGPAGDDGDGVLEVGETWVYTLATNAPTPPLAPGASTAGRCADSQPPDSQTIHKNTGTATVSGVQKTDPAHACINAFDGRKLINGLNANDPNDPAGLPKVAAGAPITVDFVVELTSGADVPAADIDITDNVFGDIVVAGVPEPDVTGPAGDDGDGVLEAGETWVYTLATNAPTPPLDPNASAPGRCSDSQDPDSQTLHKNTVTVTVDGVDDRDDAHLCVNDYRFRKLIEGFNANRPNSPVTLPKVAAGAPITVDFEVELTSGADVPAADIDITDNVFGDIVVAGAPEPDVTGPAGDDGDGVLEVGETWVYSLATDAPMLPLDPAAATMGRCAGSQPFNSQEIHKNTGTATVSGVPKSDPAHACINGFDFTKLINGLDANDPNDPAGLPKVAAGAPITVDFAVELTSGQSIHRVGVSIVDSVFGPIVVAGVNQPGVSGPAGDDGDNFLEFGETWTYTLSAVAPTPPLDPNASAPGRCSDSQAPDSQTLHKNTATATVNGVDMEDDAHLCLGTFVFDKLINGLDADDPNDLNDLPKVNAGDPITVDFALELASGADVPAAAIDITDNVFGDIVVAGVPQPGVSGPAGDDGDGVLEAGETWVYTLNTTAPTPPLDPNASAPGRCSESQDPDSQTLHKNTATVTVDGVDDRDDAHLCVGDYVFDKLINGLDADDPNVPADLPKVASGDLMTVDFVVELVSGEDVAAAGVSVTDDVFGDIVVAGVPEPGVSGPAGDDGDGLLEVGETWVYTLSTVAPTPPLDPGASTTGRCADSQPPDSQTIHKNTGTATVDGVQKTDPAHACITSFNFRKFINGRNANDPNGPLPQADAGGPLAVEFRIALTSGAGVPGADIDVTDDVFGPIVAAGAPVPPVTGPAGDDGDGVLDVGEVWIYTLNTTAPTLPLDPTASTAGRCAPSQPPGSVTVHKNTATATVSGIEKTDPAHACIRDIDIEKLTQPVVPAGGSLGRSNHLGADADDPNGADVPGANLGEQIRWNFVVTTGAGGVPILANQISVSDDTIGPIVTNGVLEPGVTGPAGDDGDGVLEPGEEWVYTASGVGVDLNQPPPGVTVVPGCGDGRPTYENIGTVTAFGLSDDDPSHYCNRPPPLLIQKLTNGNDADGASDSDVPRVKPGETVTWTYEVTNAASSSVAEAQVTVTDSVPGVNPVRNPALGSHDGDNLLEPGETWVYEASGAALDLSQAPPAGTTVVQGCGYLDAAGDPATQETYENVGRVDFPGGFATDPSHYCNVRIDLQIEKEAIPEEVIAGLPFDYEITVTNFGPSTATDVVMLDVLPARCQPGSIGPLGLPCPVQTQTDPPFAGSFAGFPGFGDFNNGANPANDVDDPAFQIDNPDITPFSERQKPQGGEFVSVSATNGAACAYDAGVHGVRCDLASLADGASFTVTITMRMDPFARVRVWNRAWVFADETNEGLEPNTIKEAGTPCGDLSNTNGWPSFPTETFPQPAGPGCNYSKKNAEPDPEIDLAVTKTDTRDPVQPGEQYSYTLDITNNGPSGALQVFAVDTLPPEVTFVSADPGCVHAAGVVECDIGALAANAVVQRTITVEVPAGTPEGRVDNRVVVENREAPPGAPVETDLTNNADEEPTDIVAGSIGDFVWADVDGDGVQDPGEAGIPNVTVDLDGPGGPQSAVTDGAGMYLFDGLVSGDYTVTVDTTTAPAGWTATTPTTVPHSLGVDQDFLDADFGFVPPAPLGSIGDFVWLDLDGDGVQDPGEPGIAGVTVNLDGPGGAQTAVTDVTGFYLFAGLAAGDYTATVDVTTVPAGHAPSTATSVSHTLAPDEDFLDADFGFLPLGSIGDFVWLDLDGDGVQDPGEPGIAGVTVNLNGPGGPQSATTNADGLYLFTGLAAGEHAVEVVGPAGFTATTPTGVEHDLGVGQDFLDADFGFVQPIDLELTKGANPTVLDVGEQTTFTIVVTNQGPADATGVTVDDVLPTGLTYVSDTGGGAYVAATGVWTIGDLAAGDDASLAIVATVDAAGTFTNVAQVSTANEPDVDSTPGNDVPTEDDQDDATVSATAVLITANIGDFVWLDRDRDARQDAGEPGIAGAKVTLTDVSTGAQSQATTDATGRYLFVNLNPGNYRVVVDTRSVANNLGLTTTGTYNVNLQGGQDFLTADFGFAEILPRTGMDADAFGGLGIVLVVVGAFLLLTTRRRERRGFIA